MNTVFGLEETKDADGFLFTEEDYVVAPTIYETIQTGFSYIDEGRQEKYFGLAFDPTEGYTYNVNKNVLDRGWKETAFVTGPMAIRRDMFAKIKSHAKDYCTWDDYNWDWTIVHLMGINAVPYQILVPAKLQVAHIGLEGGLHEKAIDAKKKAMMLQYRNHLESFHQKIVNPYDRERNKLVKQKPFGGWGHPADQEHCMKLFGVS